MAGTVLATTTPATQGSIVIPPPPPRMAGPVEQVVEAIVFWLNQFYQYGFLQNAILTAGQQSQSGTFDPSTLPDPASATVASAQDTANKGYTLANAAKGEADKLQTQFIGAGTVTISDTATTAVITLPTEKDSKGNPILQPDTNFSVVLTPSDFSGTPTVNAFLVIKQVKTTADTTITINTHPGTGNSVSYDWIAMRN